MRKKKIVFAIIMTVLTGFISGNFGNNTNAAKELTDIGQLVGALEEQDGKLVEWSLYTRETITQKDGEKWNDTVRNLQKRMEGFSWELTENNSVISAVGVLEHKSFTEKIKLVFTAKNRQEAPYLFYELSGTRWNEENSQKVRKRIDESQKLLFQSRPVIFSCIKGVFNAKLDDVVSESLPGMLAYVDAEMKESARERDFYSISAYSSLLTQSLPLPNTQMNMQIGLRMNGSGDATVVAIGTPILTIEY